MGLEAIFVVILIVVAMFFFATDYVPIDVVAISLIVILVTSGIISPKEGVMGFANNATLTVAGMFVLSYSLIKTKVIDVVAPYFKSLMRNGQKKTILGISLPIGLVSAFINNTPVVATFIPIMSNSAKRAKIPSSKILIPLSYIAIFGGTCTLIGTSTNLLVSGIAEEKGLEPFSMFLMTPLGVIFFIVGTTYLYFFSKKLLPHEEIKEMSDEDEIENFVTEITLNIKQDEMTLSSFFEELDLDLKVDALKRNNDIRRKPEKETKLKNKDSLLIRGDLKQIKKLLKSDIVNISESFKDEDFPNEITRLIEIVLLPNSDLLDKKLNEISFLDKYQANILAIRQTGKPKFTNLKDIKLKAGDILLLQTNQRGYDLISESQTNKEAPFLSMYETKLEKIKTRKLFIVLTTIISVITLASLNIVPIMIGTLGAIVILNLTNVITMNEAYKAIDWKVIFLLAGALSLEKAMTNSGVTENLANLLIDSIGKEYGGIAVVSALYLITNILTETMSNNAAAALLTPVAISTSATMGWDATPLILAIAFAGSASFMTPVGYQTNTMVYSAGGYKFTDFTKVGSPLNLMFWILATLLIPIIYPL